MIIPVRCFTCGEVLADKWIPYITAIQDDKTKINKEVDSNKNIDLKTPMVSYKISCYN